MAFVAHGCCELFEGIALAFSLGERPITRLKAVLKALSDSYPSETATADKDCLLSIRRVPAISMRQLVR